MTHTPHAGHAAPDNGSRRPAGVHDSIHPSLLVLRIGQFTTAVHPTHPVTVAPQDHQLTVTARPNPVQQRIAARDGEQ